MRKKLHLFLAVLSGTVPLTAQSSDSAAVVAVTDSAFAAISRNDFAAFADLMIDEAVVVATRVQSGAPQSRVSNRAAQRAITTSARWTERGWSPTVQLQGGIATVWSPYDFYQDGKWSHCGIDTFTLIKREVGWRIVSLVYTIEQPPTCAKHPKGPPG